MSRLFYVEVLLAIATLLSAPSLAQTSASKSPDNARVEHIAVRGSGDAMEVEIRTSGAPVTPDTQAITGPDRIIVDFPGALPAAELHALALKVNSGALKGIRAGLFFNNPPITRIVLDLEEPQSYRISTTRNAIVVKLGPADLDTADADRAKSPNVRIAPAPRLQNASLAADTRVAVARVSNAVADMTPEPLPPKPPVNVTFVEGMLSIHSEKATLAQVLYEVQVQTQAEIAIPAGAETEQVIADLGPAPARDVLAALLNGSPYNFIFVGDELSLERVIITRRDPNIF